jgi:hypothetical protein
MGEKQASGCYPSYQASELSDRIKDKVVISPEALVKSVLHALIAEGIIKKGMGKRGKYSWVEK